MVSVKVWLMQQLTFARYRAPEMLLGAKTYDCSVDIWGCGAVFAEFLLLEPMFKVYVKLESVSHNNKGRQCRN